MFLTMICVLLLFMIVSINYDVILDSILYQYTSLV
jgi:hypothetical protein